MLNILHRNASIGGALLVFTSPVLANSKSLLVNGVNAAVTGDLSFDKGDWRNNESFSALHLRAGFQLIRVGFTGLTIGYQKVGFYNAEKNLTKGADNKTHFDYRGPVLELHLFPDAMFAFSLALHKGEGFSFTKGQNASELGYSCNIDGTTNVDPECSRATVERSRLSVDEYTGQVAYTYSPGLQVFVGAGIRHIKGTPALEAHVAYKNGSESGVETKYLTYGQSQWVVDSKFILLGIRGSTL